MTSRGSSGDYLAGDGEYRRLTASDPATGDSVSVDVALPESEGSRAFSDAEIREIVLAVLEELKRRPPDWLRGPVGATGPEGPAGPTGMCMCRCVTSAVAGR